MMFETCGVISERAQVILVRVRAPDIGNTSYPWKLRIMIVKPKASIAGGILIQECPRSPQLEV